MVNTSQKYEYVFKSSIIGDSKAWLIWKQQYLPSSFHFSIPVQFVEWIYSFFDTKCRIVVFFLSTTRDIHNFSNKFLYAGSMGIFLVLNRANPRGFEMIEESLKTFKKNNKEKTTAYVLLCCTVTDSDTKSKSSFITDEEINQYIIQISEKYNCYVPHYNLDKLTNFDIPSRLIDEMIYIQHEIEIPIRSKLIIEQIHYIYEKRKDPNYLNQLKDFIENTDDESLIILIIDIITKKEIDDDYLNYLLNKKNLSTWCQIFIRLILNKDIKLKELKTILKNTTNHFKSLMLVNRIKDDTLLSYIIIHNKSSEIKSLAFDKLKKPLKEDFLKKLIWSNSNSYLISKATMFLKDQEEIRKIIFSELDWDIKTAALKNLNPPFEPEILNILNLPSDTDFKVTLVNKLSGDLLLRKIIFEANGDEVKGAALEKLNEVTDKYLMNLILSHDYKFGIYFKTKCLDRIKDQNNKIKLYKKLRDPEFRIEILKRIEPLQVDLVKEILFKVKNDKKRQKVLDRIIFNDQFSLADFMAIVEEVKKHDNLVSLIGNCQSLKLLNALRLRMGEEYQSVIKNQILKLDQN